MSNDLRIGGLASGIDTEDIISKMVKYSKAPIDRLKQDEQILIWKQEAYRTHNTEITSLRDMIFDLKLESTYGSKQVTSTNSQVVTATASSNALNTSYNITVDQLATVAANSSSASVSMRSSLYGDYLANEITIDATNNTFAINLDGVQKNITLSASAFGSYKYDNTAPDNDLEDLAAAIQTELDAAGFTEPVYVKASDDHELLFYTGQKIDGTAHTLVVKNALTATGTATGGSNNTITLAATASDLSDYYNGMSIQLTSGTGEGQTRQIIAYDAVTKIATLDSDWSTAGIPDGTSTYSVDLNSSSGTAQNGGAANEIILANFVNNTDDFYQGMTITITNGTGAGETRTITDYDAATKTATLSADWATNPDATSEYTINIPTNGSVQVGGATNEIIMDTFSSEINDYYTGMKIKITSGTGKEEIKTITGYDALTKTATLDSDWTNKPDGTSEYELLTDLTLSNLGFNGKDTSKELVGDILTAPVTIDTTNNKFKITVGDDSSAQTITLADGTYSLDEFAAEIESKIRAVGGNYDQIRVDATNYNQLRFTPWDTDVDNADAPLSITLESGTTNDVLWKMGFSDETTSHYPKDPINADSSLWSQKDKFIDDSFFEGKDTETNKNFSFALNGQGFNFTVNNTLNEIISEINSTSEAEVMAYYDSFTDKLTFTSTNYGNNNETGAEIQITDTDGFLSDLFGITESNETGGQNAEVNINGVQTERTTNEFTLNDVTFNLIGTGGPATVKVSTDTSGVSDEINSFVEEYNTLIEALNADLSEERATSGKYKYYKPLTADQKSAMTEEEIENWETKAKEGLLRSDTTLQSAVREMRSGLARIVETPLTLTGIALSGTVDLSGSNRFEITVGSQTREIVLAETAYTNTDYDLLASDIQKQLDLNFGINTVQVALSGDSLTFTSHNLAMTLDNASQSNGLNALGFSSGMKVTAKYDRLEQIGLTTGDYSENGKLYLDKTKFEEALADDPDGVIRLLTNYEEIETSDSDTAYEISQKEASEASRKGIFYNLHEILTTQVNNFTQKAGLSGTFSGTNTLGEELLRLSERMDILEERLADEEERLWRTFSSMESMINEMNSQGAWLSSIIGQLSGSGES